MYIRYRRHIIISGTAINRYMVTMKLAARVYGKLFILLIFERSKK